MSYYAQDNRAYRDQTMASDDWGGGGPGWGMWPTGLRYGETLVGVGADVPVPDPAPAPAPSTVPTSTVWLIAGGGVALGIAIGYLSGRK